MRTPLRYPGGKTKFANMFSKIIQKKGIINPIFVEPYCGGAGAAIKLLLDGNVKKIYINDNDRSIYAFWWAILNNTDRFVEKLKRIKITLKEFDKQKKVQKNKNEVDLFTLGFSTFFINRTAFSGILTGGPLGGRTQNGKYKLDCRFGKTDLITRIKLIAKNKNNIIISNKDAIVFLNSKRIENLSKKNTLFYIDPPYFQKGVFLYKNNYIKEDHENLESVLRSKSGNIFISYDDTKEIRKIYNKWRSKKKSVPHSAGTYKIGKEILITK